MSDDTPDQPSPAANIAGNPEADQSAAPQLALLAQYVKDLSFENPGSPGSLASGKSPKISVNFDVQAQQGANDQYEIALKISANAVLEDNKPAFVVELVYGGLFVLSNFPQNALEPACLIECPRILFPFARRIVADATRDGGFPPLMLDMIDFNSLYMQHHQQRSAAGQGAEQESGTANVTEH